MYAVFDRAKAYSLILAQRGRFTPSLLAMTAWREYGDAEQRLFLSLMESCAIAFVCRDADLRLGLETEYLAPDMLPEKAAVDGQLAGRWNDEQGCRRLEYEYAFLHPGLMRALVCDVGRHSKEAGVYWRYGLWVYDQASGCRALLEQKMLDQRRGRISLMVQGTRHEALAQWLRGRIEDRNRLFGHAELKPVIDELGSYPPTAARNATAPRPASSPANERRPKRIATAAGQESALGAAEPRFEKLSPSQFPTREPQVFVSYAWGDGDSEGLRRGQLVDELCAAAKIQGLTIRRDRDEIRPGDLISEFMDRLSDGDHIVAVISDKYLRSEYCMYELFRIYRNCADRPERFLGKVIPLILPDAMLDTLDARLARAIHWTDQERALKPLVESHVDAVGAEFFRKFKLIGEFARNTSNMLEHLVDKLQPRDFDRQVRISAISDSHFNVISDSISS